MSESILPLVTIIVPCYNHEKYVEKCLDSIFRQTYPNFEVIVVDDCSPDNSAEVIKQLQTKYDFQFIEHKENWGLTKTLNDVIYNHANGKYIKCIASDDYLTDDCVEVLTSEIEKLGNDYAMVYGLAKIFGYDGFKTVEFDSEIGKKYESFKSLFISNVVPAPSVLFSKACFLDVGGFDPDMYIEDYYLWLQFAAKYKLSFINKVVSFYFANNHGSMSAKYDLMLASGVDLRTKIFINHLDQLSIDDYIASIKKRIGGYYFEYFSCQLSINKGNAWKILVKHYQSINDFNIYGANTRLFLPKCFLKVILPTKFVNLLTRW